VTAESLAIWKADRAARKREEERIRVEREIAKKGKKKGLGVLSGRALFDYDASLFRCAAATLTRVCIICDHVGCAVLVQSRSYAWDQYNVVYSAYMLC
jgi:hypothetical protein